MFIHYSKAKNIHFKLSCCTLPIELHQVLFVQNKHNISQTTFLLSKISINATFTIVILHSKQLGRVHSLFKSKKHSFQTIMLHSANRASSSIICTKQIEHFTNNFPSKKNFHQCNDRNCNFAFAHYYPCCLLPLVQ